MRVAIYARVSKADKDDPKSIPVQLADCRDRAERKGWEVVTEYVDQGRSGWNPKVKRQGWEDALAALQAGEFDAILARDLERLLRQDKEGARILDMQARHPLWLFADEATLDLRRASDKKTFKDRVSNAVYLSDRISEKVKSSKRRRREAGLPNGGGRRAFGLRWNGEGLDVVPEEARLIREAYDRIVTGVTLYRVCMDWNAAGVRTAHGSRWAPSRLARSLVGEHLVREEILTEDEHDFLRARLSKAERPPGRPQGTRYPATGILRCSECDTKLIASGNAYRCQVTNGGCGKVSVRAMYAERWLLSQLLAYWMEEITQVSRDWVELEMVEDWMDRPAQRVIDVEPQLKRLREVEDSIQRLVRAVVNGTFTEDEARSERANLDGERDDLMKIIAEASPPPVTDVTPADILNLLDDKSIQRIFASLTDGNVVTPFLKALRGERTNFAELYERRELEVGEYEIVKDLLRDNIRQATVCPVGKGSRFDPSRIEISWRN